MIRRDFLKDAVVAGGALVASRLSPAGSFSSWSRRNARIAVVYDERYSDSRRFADAFVERGAAAFQTSGDSAKLWYGALRKHLVQHGGGLAGLTTVSDLDVLQMSCREVQLKLTYQADHDARRSNTLTLLLRAGDLQQAVAHSRVSWAEALAEELNATPAGDFANRKVRDQARTWRIPRSVDHPGYLTSWLLLPA